MDVSSEADVRPLLFTLSSACQDCSKCLRSCAVHAMTVRGGRVEPDRARCLACGQCVAACPSRAKAVRNDLDRVKAVLKRGEPVAVSLAPSWRGAATGFNRPRLVSALKALGATLVGETALGAESVTRRTAAILNGGVGRRGLLISSACPVVADYVRLYRPEFVSCLAPLASPALTHAKLLKERWGPELQVVFVGPCVAKKAEADRRPDLLAAALTFEELKSWLREESLKVEEAPYDPEAGFWPRRAHEGALYSLSGGMLEGLRVAGVDDSVQLMSVSSLPLVSAALNGLALADLRHSVFLEALACQGGCLRGPAISTARPLVLMTSDLLRHVVRRSDAEPDEPPTIAPAEFAAAPLARTVHSLEDLQAALALLGKHRPEDEIDCAGCGYPSCRELAAAILDGAAESRMCVSNMRQQAARKAEAMIRAMPSALVMVDRDLKILEVNEAFVRMFAALPERGGGPAAEPGDALVGAPVSRWLEIGALLRKVLRTGRDVHREHWLLRKNIFNVYAFSVEKFRSAGAIVTDMTSLKAGRAGLARKAREVISKNIATVQEIACLLGEHMVETESILSAIAADFEAADEPAGPLDAGEDGGRPDDADAAADDVGA